MDKTTFEHGPILPDLFAHENLAALDFLSARYLTQDFLSPISSYMQRPRKNFRAKLVEVGAMLVAPEAKLDHKSLLLIQEAIECLHTGSLIIDDLQDGSALRRGLPAFHAEHGDSRAICSGNWMYFWPLRLLGKVSSWSPEQRLYAYERFHRALELAHYGQFLDLNTKTNRVETRELGELSYKTAELKSGTITALALELGALLANASKEQLDAVNTFGGTFGLALQRLDDWGNVAADKAKDKRFEDLLTYKPTTIWHDVLTLGDADDLTNFIEVLSSFPDTSAVEDWLSTSAIPTKAMLDIKDALTASLDWLENHSEIPKNSLGPAKLRVLIEDLKHAYT